MVIEGMVAAVGCKSVYPAFQLVYRESRGSSALPLASKPAWRACAYSVVRASYLLYSRLPFFDAHTALHTYYCLIGSELDTSHCAATYHPLLI